MRHGFMSQGRKESGFSLVELLAVVAIIVIMAAVALPNIVGFARNYRLNGALRSVGNEIQAARTKAIMTNSNAGVSFLIADRNSYRFAIEDTAPATLSPLRDLPQGIAFDILAGGGATATMRFNRFGNFCNPAVAGSCSAVALAPPFCTPADLLAGGRCADAPAPANLYMATDTAGIAGGVRIVLVDARLGTPQAGDQRRTVRITPGGRILPQQQ